MKTTKVVNIRKDSYDVKICRKPDGTIPSPPQLGCFGNPFILHDTNDDVERAEVIRKYREYFYKRIENEPAFKEAVLALRGKRLACFCAPKACHGDVIVEYLESQDVHSL